MEGIDVGNTLKSLLNWEVNAKIIIKDCNVDLSFLNAFEKLLLTLIYQKHLLIVVPEFNNMILDRNVIFFEHLIAKAQGVRGYEYIKEIKSQYKNCIGAVDFAGLKVLNGFFKVRKEWDKFFFKLMEIRGEEYKRVNEMIDFNLPDVDVSDLKEIVCEGFSSIGGEALEFGNKFCDRFDAGEYDVSSDDEDNEDNSLDVTQGIVDKKVFSALNETIKNELCERFDNISY
ncbi:hypothetical protein BN7_6772 [Wickerhamomyces ciferrii]|uniref:Uncharacterized protein n=1 Tax=Wickerhamomyces ciferrii (strain ATCC 14091 / BCRC 22168 / CBS 111 / JCM 3599 / NBRC 0793 / NRRL Y-1031 F-60-10) TaxID=1206466 RepID=K0KYK8_WICCF|nr:uncharacterized protein BN7_6772 [Wickerhamomyces ciferrii]CCH47157.1 hypothetical protein BN7_6772 [Wickerhamomyces ciferrii]